MPKGYLKIQLTTALDAKPIRDAMIRIYQDINEEIINETFYMSDAMGVTPYIPLDAVEEALSLDENNRIRPYSIYNVEIRAENYETIEIVGVQIFANQLSSLPLNLIPNYSRDTIREVSYINDHQLLTDGNSHEDQLYPPVFRLLTRIIIPKRITVHLGRPTSSGENLNVDFIYYIKNVASSEIYPTWNENALRANIYCQISLTLNRIYTEWYPSKGYNFDITNSTAYDQAFVKNRNIFDNISKIVDEIFNEFIQKDAYAEPYYAEYCDGKIAQCPGLKQWGTQTLALQGYSVLGILQYYYGNLIQIVTSNHIQEIKQSYPGTPLRIGSRGIDVTQIQKQLNAIAINYPAITPIFPIDGIFGMQTDSAVRIFQRQFNLSVDGVVGKSTWYKISYIYVAVRKLAELTSLGIQNEIYNGAYPGTPLRYGDKGVQVQFLQYLLQAIATYDSDIRMIPTVDGDFGNNTYQSVLSFQRKYHLTVDGIVGMTTWNKIYSIFQNYEQNITGPYPIPPYPQTTYQLGATGENVRLIQEALNVVGTLYSSIPVLVVDGLFGQNTAQAVRTFQRIANLNPDGIVGVNTWNALFTLAAQIQNGDLPSVGLPAYIGIPLRLNSTGEDVRLIQDRLQSIAIYYPGIPRVQANGIYDMTTQSAVSAFQELLGLDIDGIVDRNTWYRINEIYVQLTQ